MKIKTGKTVYLFILITFYPTRSNQSKKSGSESRF